MMSLPTDEKLSRNLFWSPFAAVMVNVPLYALPHWMQVVASGLPLTHGIAAARAVAAGAPLSSVDGLVGKELAVGVCYAVLAYVLLRIFEVEGRRRASLELI